SAAARSHFSCSADHSDSHSFPTRRSSDLLDRHANRARRHVFALANPVLERTMGSSPHAHRTPVNNAFYDALGERWLLAQDDPVRSEEHTSELQSRENLVCRLLLEKKKKNR